MEPETDPSIVTKVHERI